ncbi:MAG: vanadium-dependent haloperoxidase [Acidimicrobiia bacterium]
MQVSRRAVLGWMAGSAVAASTGVGWAGAAGASTGSSAVADEWFDLLRALVAGTPGYSPPVAARAFGYAGVGLYEAVVPGMDGHRSLAGLLNGLAGVPAAEPAPHHWPAVANRVLAQLARSLFPTAPAALKARVDGLEAQYGNQFRTVVPADVYDRSVPRGTAVAAAILRWSRTDGAHEAYLSNFPTDYVPPTGPGKWIPTPPAFQRALQPRWGAVRRFLPGSADECAPPGPPAFSTERGTPFWAEAMQVRTVGAYLTPDQRAIAVFWSDDPGLTSTPPGHSISILTQVLRADGASLAKAAEAYARVGIAVADAFICCWKVKFTVNLLRPVSYVRQVIDPAWTPLLTTPPFPEFPSGHSTQSAAAATVLTSLFGSRSFTDHTHDARGLPPRTFSSFNQAAAEAAMSRLYGGIHFISGIQQGLNQGYCLGARVAALRLG